jgi:2-polyprenyl-3-methyl-5-hydroxy-6-metoxy-1,4-benzoquinol methylase
MIHYSECPVCSGTSISKVFSCQDYTVSQKFFNILECGSCSVRFTQNVPDLSEIGSYYASEDYISHTDTNKGIINKLYHAIRKFTLKQKKSLLLATTKLFKGKILDIGCGTGSFLETMKNAGWETVGLEPNLEARNLASAKNIESHEPNHLFNLSDKQFDVISLWHVLEHVHDLHNYIEQFKRLLKDNGLLVIAVPNYTSSDASHYDAFWAAYDVPRHLYHFSPKSMKILLEKHQFNIEAIKPMWFDSYYVSLLSEGYKQNDLGFLKAIKHGTISNYNALINSKMASSIIYLIRSNAL